MLSLQSLRVPWRTIQTAVNVSTIITSFCTFLPLGYVSSYFSWQCVLYTDIKVTSANSTAILVDKERTVWGSITTCYFTTYTPMFAGIHAFIWCWYFLFMKAQLKSEHQEFPLLVASFLLHGILCVVVFVASGMISAGIDSWCRNLVSALRRKQTIMTCADTQSKDWPNIYTDAKKHPIYSFLFTAKVSCWLQTLTILCQTLVCGYKLYKWILGTTGGKLDIRKCRRSLSVDSSFNGDGYRTLQDDSDEDGDIVYSLEDGDNRCFSGEES